MHKVMLSQSIKDLGLRVRMVVDLASNRLALPPEMYKNKEYYPDGILVLAMDSPEIYSFANIYEVRSFLRMRLYGMELYPNADVVLTFYSESSQTIDSYSHVRKSVDNPWTYEYVGVVHLSRFDAAYRNRLKDGNLYTKKGLPWWFKAPQE